MKVEVIEHGVDAESVEDAARLFRLAMSRTTELRSLTTFANTDGTIATSVVIGKRADSTTYISKAIR